MGWIQKINSLDKHRKENLYRMLIPPSVYHRIGINPLNFCDKYGERAVRFFCPEGDRTCLVEIKINEIEEPVYSIQISDSIDATMLEWDFLIINDPESDYYCTNIDEKGKDTLFGWAARNLKAEKQAVEAGYLPGQTRRGLGCTREVIESMDIFCRTLGIKSISLEALFYHNAITYERMGYCYFDGYREMKRIDDLFRFGGILYERLDNRNPFRKKEFARTVSGRSWAIHDGILEGVEDDILGEGWTSPRMYRMVGKPRTMITFPYPVC